MLIALAAAISEERDTIEDVIEPYLIQQGFLMRTARGELQHELPGYILAWRCLKTHLNIQIYLIDH